jgi:hypothetical protein
MGIGRRRWGVRGLAYDEGKNQGGTKGTSFVIASMCDSSKQASDFEGIRDGRM